MKSQSRLGITIPGGSGVAGAISVTYSELTTLISGGDLIVGQEYLITNYQTVHFIPNTAAINTGPIEPLLVTALTPTKLNPIAYSTLHQDDIIYYTPTNGSTEYPGSTRGFITRRIDTINNNDISTDWRYCKYRRFKITETAWDAATTYNKWDIVKSTTTNDLYVSTKNTNLNNIVTDTDSWLLLPIQDQDYVGIYPTTWQVGDVIFTTSDVDFQDFFTFVQLELGYSFYNNTIISDKLFNSIFLTGASNLVNNNIINVIDDTTIVGLFENNIFADTTNNFMAGSTSNNIGPVFENNIISNSFYSNIVGERFTNNIVGPSATYNTIRDRFDSNLVGGSFYNNIIAINSHDNILGGGFANNIIYQTFDNNRIVSSFGNNIIYEDIGLTDFTSATHVYNAYTTEIVKKPDNSLILRYVDNTNIFVFASITS